MNTFRNSFSLNNTLFTIQNTFYFVFFVLLITAIIPFFLLTFYAHPGADDYSYAAAYKNSDFWNHIAGEYLSWKGRYFGIFVTVIFHQSGDMIANYKYPLLLFLSLFFFALYYFVRSAFEEQASYRQTLLCSLALGVFYIITLPNVPAALYWADGGFQYQVGGIFFLLSLASLLRLHREQKSPAFATLCSVLFIFASIGSHEIYMVTISTLVGLIFLYKFFVLKENRKYWFIVLLVTIVSSALLVFAPGNEVRMALQPANSQQFWFSVGRSIYHGGETLGDWLSHPVLWLLSILFIPFALFLVYIKGVRNDANWRRLMLMLALLTGQLWLCFFATWWAGATPAPTRALNAIYLIFLVGWFLLLFELVAVLTKSRRLVYTERFFSIPGRIFLLTSTILLCLLLVSKTHVHEAYSDLLGRASAYDKFMQDRYTYIRKQKRESKETRPVLTVDMVKNPPRILVYTDISRDRNDWRNNGYAKYFGLKSIATK